MSSSQKKHIERRRVLQLMLAGGAALGASAFLPEKWVKPQVVSGVLPVHAQASSTLGTIYGKVSAGSLDFPYPNNTINVYAGDITFVAKAKMAKLAVLPPPVATTLTNANGEYEVTGLTPGTYTVDPQDASPKLAVVTAGGRTQVNFFVES